MKKSLFVVLGMFSVSSVFAANLPKGLEHQVLVALVEKSKDLILVDKYTGKKSKRQLSELIASQLTYGFAQPDGTISLGGLMVSCKNGGSVETFVKYQCEVLFSVGSFEKKETTIEGPSSDSSITIEVPVSVEKTPGATPLIYDQVLMSISAD